MFFFNFFFAVAKDGRTLQLVKTSSTACIPMCRHTYDINDAGCMMVDCSVNSQYNNEIHFLN